MASAQRSPLSLSARPAALFFLFVPLPSPCFGAPQPHPRFHPRPTGCGSPAQYPWQGGEVRERLCLGDLGLDLGDGESMAAPVVARPTLHWPAARRPAHWPLLENPYSHKAQTMLNPQARQGRVADRV